MMLISPLKKLTMGIKKMDAFHLFFVNDSILNDYYIIVIQIKRNEESQQMASITINGNTYSGNNITVQGDTIIIDGKVAQGGLTGIVEIKVEGDVASINSSAAVSVTGDVHGYVDANGGVKCGNVDGDVKANGGVKCGNVGQNVKAGGGVTAGNVGGDVRAGGGIKYVK